MGNVYICFISIAQLYIMMTIGIIGKKAKVISRQTSKGLTSILINIVAPLIIFVSYQIEFSQDKLNNLLEGLVLAIIVHAVAFLVAAVFFKKSSKNFEINRLSVIFSNAGFMGIPIVQSMFGLEGVFYVAVYLIVFNIMMWTYGIFIMKGKTGKGDYLKLLKSPNIIAIVIGLFCFYNGLLLPQIVLAPLVQISSLNTPLAMLVAGVSLTSINFKSILKNKNVYFVSFLRLILVPLICTVIFKYIPIIDEIKIIMLVISACPVATLVTMLSLNCNKDDVYASEIFGMSTILSVITIPMIIYLFNII